MTRKTFQKRSWQYVGDINNMNMFERQVSSMILPTQPTNLAIQYDVNTCYGFQG
jgi:hypothetical protein